MIKQEKIEESADSSSKQKKNFERILLHCEAGLAVLSSTRRLLKMAPFFGRRGRLKKVDLQLDRDSPNAA